MPVGCSSRGRVRPDPANWMHRRARRGRIASVRTAIGFCRAEANGGRHRECVGSGSAPGDRPLWANCSRSGGTISLPGSRLARLCTTSGGWRAADVPGVAPYFGTYRHVPLPQIPDQVNPTWLRPDGLAECLENREYRAPSRAIWPAELDVQVGGATNGIDHGNWNDDQPPSRDIEAVFHGEQFFLHRVTLASGWLLGEFAGDAPAASGALCRFTTPDRRLPIRG